VDEQEFEKDLNIEQKQGYEQPEDIVGDSFKEFLAQVQFKRSSDIEGYSFVKIPLTFVPFKLGPVSQKFKLFFENQDYSTPIEVEILGECVDVPIYVEKPEYHMKVLVYEQFYREKVLLFNRSALPMKIQLFFNKAFKPYLEFNPTLGYIQGRGVFEIWFKFRPDRSILANCQKYLVKQDDGIALKDEYEEFTMRIPIKVTCAN
jgi:hypothetical protein